MRSTITLINNNSFELQYNALEYLEWLFLNTQDFFKSSINQIQPLITSTFRTLAKTQPSLEGKLLHLLNIFKKLSGPNIDHTKNCNDGALHEDINIFLSKQDDITNIVQCLQHLKLKVSCTVK